MGLGLRVGIRVLLQKSRTLFRSFGAVGLGLRVQLVHVTSGSFAVHRDAIAVTTESNPATTDPEGCML